MKDEPIRHLGLDVHRSTVVASVRDEQGKVVMKATVATEEKAIVSLVRSAGPRVHVAFEEGTQAQWLYDLLLDPAERVVVCNVPGRDALRNANDRIDADEMSKRLRDGSLKPVFKAGLRSLHGEFVQQSLDVFRNGNRNKPRLWVKVIFPRFIDDAHVVSLCRRRVFKDLIHLAKFERAGVFAIVNANREMPGFGHASIEISLDLHPTLTDTVCFIPVNFGFSNRTILESDSCEALQLPPVTRPKSSWRTARSRIPCPEAIVSIARIGPMTSNDSDGMPGPRRYHDDLGA